MIFDILTIFPHSLQVIFSESILGKAQERSEIQINVHDLRKWTFDKRNTVDDKPYGGGPGMLMMVEPIYKCLKEISAYPKDGTSKTKIILTAAGGETWSQTKAQTYAENLDRLVIICGHYEGVDYRVAENLVDEEVSIGNYVLTGGELPAAIITDSIARLLPGVIGNPESLTEESHSLENATSEYPQYTRPAEFTTEEGETWGVPPTLLSGNHQKIKEWREQMSQ